jgi:hypothetical protein
MEDNTGNKRFQLSASSGNDLNVIEMVNNDSQMTKIAEQLNMNTKIKIYFDQHEQRAAGQTL